MRTNDKVRELLAHKGQTVWWIRPNSTVLEALRLMAEKNIGALPVVEGERVVGIFSERDYARKVVLKGRSSKELAVSEIMSSPVTSITPQHSIDECMKLMTQGRLRHLPVIEENQLTGMVSIGDLVSWIISAQEQTIHQLQDYIMGKYPG